MATQNVTANSRLTQIQMKFQKKQLLEREQKKLALKSGDISQELKSTNSNGKVRQMFDDRRRGAGIDRSHPLRPITTTTSTIVGRKTITEKPATNKRSVVGTNVKKLNGYANSSSISNLSHLNNYSITNRGNNIFRNNFDEVDNIDNETFPKEFLLLSLNDTYVKDPDVMNDIDLESNISEESSKKLGGMTFRNKVVIPKTNGIKLNPLITRKLPGTTNTEKTKSTTTNTNNKISTLSKTIKSPLSKSSLSPTTKTIKATGNRINKSKPATFALSVKPPLRISTPPPGMVSCQYCQRHFIEERLIKHEEVCSKMISKKRKIFDASKHRVKGTEAEKYLRKGKEFNQTASKNVTSTNKTPQVKSSVKKSNWRKTHEDFLTAIREAKKVQAYLAKGGKLSDLPPPPPSENPDYIQCPHCSRRFNQSAAERHIPKCANMLHNKRKPPNKRF